MALSDELPIEQRLAMKTKAYDKFLNMQPALAKQQGMQTTNVTNKGLRDVYKGIQTGGFTGRQQASQALDQSQLELAKAKGQQAAEEDALNIQGAEMKEDIIGARQQESLGAFNRRTQEMEDAMDKAVAERAFDMGMTAKELAFHTNSKVADLGLETMKKDYDAGNISKTELLKQASYFEKEAQAAKIQADAMLRQLAQEGKNASTAYGRKRALELSLAMMEKQKEALKKQAKASNIASIITSGTAIGGAIIGGIYGGGLPGAALGASLGGSAGSMLTSGSELNSSGYNL
jgi:hypothetical protein